MLLKMKFQAIFSQLTFCAAILCAALVTSVSEAQINNAFIDASKLPKTVTSVGDASILANQSKFGGLAGYFDGNGDYLTVSPTPLSGNTSTLTIESWIYIESVGANGWPIVSQSANSASGDQQFYISGSNGGAANQNKLRFTRGSDFVSAVDLIGATSLPLNQWIHIAYTSDGTTARLFVNGVLDASTNLSTGWVDTAQAYLVAASINSALPQNQAFAKGKIADLRVSQGIARYKGSFLPFPVQPFAADTLDSDWSNTVLLLKGEGLNNSTNVVDESPSSKSISVAGNARVVTTEKKFGSSSLYFDGSGDYLTLSNTNDFGLSTADFTIEMWVKPAVAPQTGSSMTLLDSRASMGYAPFTASLYGNTNGTTLGFFDGSGNAYMQTSSPTIPVGSWSHVAWVRKSGVMSLYVNGVACVVSAGSAASAGAIDFGTSLPLKIGIAADSSAGAYNGYLDNLRITKGVARYSSNFTVPADIPTITKTGDASWAKVVYLLNPNSFDLSSIFSDISSFAKSVVPGGNAKNSSLIVKTGDRSLLLDGDGDNLYSAAGGELRLGTEDFTVESWVYLAGNSNPDPQNRKLAAILTLERSFDGAEEFLFYINGDSQTTGSSVGIYSYGDNVISSAEIPYAITQQTWHHMAVTRRQGVASFFVDGTLIGTKPFNANISSVNGIKIGGRNTSNNYKYFLNGYIDDLRITKGVARYTVSFVPATYDLQPSHYVNDPYADRVSLLLMSNLNAPAADYPRIISTTKEIIADLSVASITVNTNVAVDPATFTPDQIAVTDAAQTIFSVSSVVKLSSTQFKCIFASPLVEGNYTFKILPTFLTPTGLPLDQNNNGVGGEGNDTYTESVAVVGAPPKPVSINIDPQGKGNGTSLVVSWTDYVKSLNGKTITSFLVYKSLSAYTDTSQATLAVAVPATQKSVTLDGLLNSTTYYISVIAVDSAGNSVTQVAPVAVKPQSAIEQAISYTYYPSGLVHTEDGRRIDVSDITTYNYDTAGNRSSVVNALGQTTNYTSYDAMGRLLSVTDVNGIVSTFTYDDRGWLLTSTLKHPNNSALNAVTTYGYDAVGLMTSMTLPNAVRLDYEYDGARRLVAIKNADNERIEYQLDAAGNRTGELIKDSAGAIKYSVARAYDELSRVMNVTGNHQQQDSFKYDVNDNQTEASDALTHKTQQNFDALNRVAKVIDPNLGETKFTYDGQNRIQTVTDARGNVTTYNYDGLGNLLSQVSPDTGISTFSYDAAGNRTSAKDARGVVVNYAYDALNRLTQVTYPTSSENINYIYDDNSNGNYGAGRLTGVSSSSATINYQYNYQGLITKKAVTIGGVLSSTFYTYDLAGNLASIQYPSGRIVTYVRDTLGRVQAIKTKADVNATEQTVVSGISYLPFGPAKQYTYGNGLSHTVTYDNDYRINAITVGGVLSRGYSYDVSDNITGINDAISTTKNQTFTYDSLDRLESANGSYGYQIYSYDAVGNRTGLLFDTGSSVLSDTYNYEATSNRLSSIAKKVNNLNSPSRSFTYDSVGNRITDSTSSTQLSSYAYNNGNRLGGVTVNSALAASYTYNPLGQRVVKTLADNSKEIYHYDEAGQLIAVTNTSGVMQREYIYNGNQLVGFVNNQVVISPILLSAASATFQGSHTLSTAQTGYTGSTGFIDIVGEGQVNWALNIVTTTSYDIKVRYSLAAANRPLDVLIDGVKKGTLNFPATANWNTWSTATINLQLTSGSHTFSLKTTGTSGGNIDKVDVVPSAALIAGPTLHYVHTDHLGTPQVVTAQNQSVIWMADYQPFGQLKPNQSNSIELYSRFPGQYLDTESGLYYNYFRDYDPSIGRYIESDPIGLKGGINTYSYVTNNPSKGVDPTGLISESSGSHFKLRQCPREEYNQCNLSCMGRGGVESCKVTRGARAVIIDGEPTKELYTVPGSMSCVCKNDPPKDCPPVASPSPDSSQGQSDSNPGQAGQSAAEAAAAAGGVGLLMLLLAQ